MNEFDGKKFYGYSIHNDPGLSTTTRNFEFRYNRPEQLERAIQKVRLGAEHKKDKKSGRTKAIKNKLCEVNEAVQSHDIDVETQMTRLDSNKVRTLSENEVEQLIGKVRCPNADITAKIKDECATAPSAFMESQSHSVYRDVESGRGNRNDGTGNGNVSDNGTVTGTGSDRDQFMECPSVTGDDVADDELIFDDYQALPTYLSRGHDDTPKIEEVAIEELREPKPKWVEIVESSRSGSFVVEDVKKAKKLPRGSKSYTISRAGDDLHDRMQNIPCIDDYDPYETNDQQIFFEDSDLEYELLERDQYTKFCDPKPNVDEASDECAPPPNFIELERGMRMSFLKNTSPMRYTEMTDDIADEPSNEQNPMMKVVIKRNQKGEGKSNDGPAPLPAEKKPEVNRRPRKKSPKRQASRNAKAQQSRSPAKKSTVVHKESTAVPHVSPSRGKERIARYSASRQATTKTTPRRETPEPRLDNPKKKYFNSRSLEDLKEEKILIFTKMSVTQERIIEFMDKLRMGLIDMCDPENNAQKSKREKNAFEFSVRFSRNFLYPLKGMIDDLRNTTVEQINSASSNDACSRVGAIYALILQSMHTYYKQLRYFLLDQVPQKLQTLIEMTYSATTICLEKHVFDRNDAIIECLQDRCTKFLNFIEILNQNRMSGLDSCRRVNYDKAKIKAPRTKYDLKMFMNDLNMYEPKLVPKTPVNRKKSARPKATKRSKDPMTDSSEMMLAKPNDDAISTQVQGFEQELSSEIFKNVANTNESFNEMGGISNLEMPIKKAIFDALATVAKDQVRIALEPMIETLGSALEGKKSSDIFETILNALDTKIESMMGQGKSSRKRLKRKDKDKAKRGRNMHHSERNHSDDDGDNSENNNSERDCNSPKTSTLAKSTKRKPTKPTTRNGAKAKAKAFSPPPAGEKQRQELVDDDDTDADDDDDSVDEQQQQQQQRVEKHRNRERARERKPERGRKRQHGRKVVNDQFDKDDDSDSDGDVNGGNDDLDLEGNVGIDINRAYGGADDGNANDDDCVGGEHSSGDSDENSDDEYAGEQYSSSNFSVTLKRKKDKDQPQTAVGSKQKTSGRQGPTVPLSFPGAKSKQSMPNVSVSKSLKTNTSSSIQGRKATRFAAPGVVCGSPAQQKRQAAEEAARGNLSASSNKAALYKKRRNPRMPPPPVPTATPTALSARSTNPPNDRVELIDISDSSDDEFGAYSVGSTYNGEESTISSCASSHDPVPLKAYNIDNVQIPLTQVEIDEMRRAKSRQNKLPKTKKGDVSRKTSNESVAKKPSIVFEQDLKPVDLYPCDSPYETTPRPNLGTQKRLHRQHMHKPNIEIDRQKEETRKKRYPQMNRNKNDLGGGGLTDGNYYGNKDNKDDEIDYSGLLKERDHFLKLCSKNRFYTNPNYEKPWKVFPRISDNLVNDVVRTVENDFTIGVSKFVQDFLDLETQTQE